MSSPAIAEPTSLGLYLTQNGIIVSNDYYYNDHFTWTLRTKELVDGDLRGDQKILNEDSATWKDSVMWSELIRIIGIESLPLVEVTPEMIALACYRSLAEREESCIDDFIDYPLTREMVFKQLVHDFSSGTTQAIQSVTERKRARRRFFNEPQRLGLYVTQDCRIVSKYTDAIGCQVWQFNTATLTSDDMLQDEWDLCNTGGVFWEDFIKIIGDQALPLVRVTPEMIAKACLEDVRLRKLFSLTEYVNTPVDEHEVFRTLIRRFSAGKER